MFGFLSKRAFGFSIRKRAFTFTIGKVIATIFTAALSVLSIVGAVINGYSLSWFGGFLIFVSPWLRQWGWPHIKSLWRTLGVRNKNSSWLVWRLLTLCVVSIALFFVSGAIIRSVARRFGYLWIPLDDFVAEPVPGAFLDFLVYSLYAIVLVPSALIWLAPDAKAEESYIGSFADDRASKVWLCVLALLLWIVFIPVYGLALVILDWIE